MDQAARQRWMGILASAAPRALAELAEPILDQARYTVLRHPEIGTSMVRGRAGGAGAAFNLGEISITRCSIELTGGEIGHAYVQGRNKEHALHAAILDALLQTQAHDEIERTILAPLCDAAQMRRTVRSQKAEATRVNFFTMVRGEDA